MPYGTVNLRHGVPRGETSVTCTAGVGTMVVEFGALTKLTGNPVFEETALRALVSSIRTGFGGKPSNSRFDGLTWLCMTAA